MNTSRINDWLIATKHLPGEHDQDSHGYRRWSDMTEEEKLGEDRKKIADYNAAYELYLQEKAGKKYGFVSKPILEKTDGEHVSPVHTEELVAERPVEAVTESLRANISREQAEGVLKSYGGKLWESGSMARWYYSANDLFVRNKLATSREKWRVYGGYDYKVVGATLNGARIDPNRAQHALNLIRGLDNRDPKIYFDYRAKRFFIKDPEDQLGDWRPLAEQFASDIMAAMEVSK